MDSGWERRFFFVDREHSLEPYDGMAVRNPLLAFRAGAATIPW
jgi:hypothetical protein